MTSTSIWLGMLLAACSSSAPPTQAPPIAEPPTAEAASEPWQALGVFWPSLLALPPSEPRALPPDSAPAALGCLATGHGEIAAQLTGDDDPQRLAIRALAQLTAGDRPGAHSSLAQAVALAPEHSLVRAAQGHATLAAEDHTTAATALAKLAKLAAELEPRLGQAAPMSPVQPPGPCGVSLDPTPFAWWLAQLGQAWAAANAGDHPLALDHHNAILARQPQERLATLGAGLALMNMGRPDEAIAMVQPLTTTWPSDPFVLAELEVLAAVQQQDADAEASWERELARGGEPSTCPYEGLGLTYLSQGRTDEAKVQLERSIELDPDLGFRKYNALARILMDEGDLAGAHAMLDKSAANHPGNPEAEELLRTLARLEAEAATP